MSHHLVQVNIAKFSITKKADKLTTPTLEIQAAYQISVDQNAKSALVQTFNVEGTQNQRKFLHASISKPMPISLRCFSRWKTNFACSTTKGVETIVQRSRSEWQ